MSRLYDAGREGILDDSIEMSKDDIRAMLLSGYAFSEAHRVVSDLGPVDNGRSAALSGKSFAAGIFDAADTSLEARAERHSAALVLFKDTGSDASARLIAYIDDAVNLPAKPGAGQTVNIEWSNGPNRIFKL